MRVSRWESYEVGVMEFVLFGDVFGITILRFVYEEILGLFFWKE